MYVLTSDCVMAHVEPDTLNSFKVGHPGTEHWAHRGGRSHNSPLLAHTVFKSKSAKQRVPWKRPAVERGMRV